MKRLFLFLSLITVLGTNAQTTLESRVNAVTIYLRGAVVERTSGISLRSGEQEFVFTNLTTSLDQNSIQVKGSKDFTILSVNYRTNYMQDREPTREEKKLHDSLEYYNNELIMLNYEKQTLSEERSMILMNQDVTGTEVGIEIIQLEDLADYFRNRLKAIELELIDNREKETKLRKDAERIRRQLQNYDKRYKTPTGEVVVKVKGNRSGRSNIGVSYLVRNAGWNPVYDIRATDINAPVQLTYKGNVYQRTGVDWNDVNITLSTGNPSKSNTKPELATWWLNAYPPAQTESTGRRRTKGRAAAAEAPRYSMDSVGSGEEGEGRGMEDFTNVNQGTVNTEFEITLPYSIVSGARPISIEIQKMNLPSTYEYFTAPRFDKDAFLIAKVTGWEDYSLLPGSTNIYYAGTYVGKSYLDPGVTEDTLEMPLGRDQGISVDWEKVTDMTSKAILGSKKTVKYGYVLKLRNNKNSTVVLKVVDRYPVSARSDIEVELLEHSNASVDKETGKLTWDLIMGPGETKELKFSFEVKYPKGQDISNL